MINSVHSSSIVVSGDRTPLIITYTTSAIDVTARARRENDRVVEFSRFFNFVILTKIDETITEDTQTPTIFLRANFCVWFLCCFTCPCSAHKSSFVQIVVTTSLSTAFSTR